MKNKKKTGPHQRLRTGVKQAFKQLQGGLDPSIIGKDTQFQPGRSGNPGGRPRTKPITDALVWAIQQIPKEDPEGRIYLQLLALALIRKACRGDVAAFREYTDRVEGPVVQPVELSGSEGGPPLRYKLDFCFIGSSTEEQKTGTGRPGGREAGVLPPGEADATGQS